MKTRKLQCRIQLAASEPVAYRLVVFSFNCLYFCYSVAFCQLFFTI